MGGYNNTIFNFKDMKKYDEIWNEFDQDGNGMLDKDEAFKFVRALSAKLNDNFRYKKQIFTKKNFEDLFDKFDTDKNGYLDKTEMARFIPQTFKMQFGNQKSNTF